MNEKALVDAFASIYDFNKIGGVFNKPADEMVDLYNSLSFEELSEGIAAFESENAVECLDAAVDEFVIIVGKLQILNAAGFKVGEAIRRVNENNHSKYIPKGQFVKYNSDFHTEYNEEYGVSVIKDCNGKIRKPANFQAVDLSDLVPTSFFKQ